MSRVKKDPLDTFSMQQRHCPSEMLYRFPMTSADNLPDSLVCLRRVFIDVFVARNRKPYQDGVLKLHNNNGCLEVTWIDQFHPFSHGARIEQSWIKQGYRNVTHYDSNGRYIKTPLLSNHPIFSKTLNLAPKH